MCTSEVPPAAEASARTPYPTHAVRGYNDVKTDKSCADCSAKRNDCNSEAGGDTLSVKSCVCVFRHARSTTRKVTARKWPGSAAGDLR
eukprot:9066322-Pyramimonas_sp.AAC.1